MSAPPLLPSLPGWGWSVTKSPRFQTRTQKSVSGRQLRLVDQQYPIWSFTLTFPLLRDANDTRAGSSVGPGIGYDELRSLAGFFLALQGAYGNFLFADPSDGQVTGGFIGLGNGVISSWPLQRLFGASFYDLVLAAIADGSQPFNVYLNGVKQISGWSVGSQFGYSGVGDTLSFTTPPGSGVYVTADFSYCFLCHFSGDTMDFENFLYQLWQAKSVKFESVLP
ncbi:MAG TPA: DUF2460 domain-containing protein [Stellaceae bacterium]|nr:DUF2460 domain-containing protein [Stellaceae bacterium]